MTMKKMLFAMCCLAMTSWLAAELAVRNIKVQQRWPWNGLVDIDYEVVCSDANADVYVYFSGIDKDLNKRLKMTSITGEGANNQPVKAGRHRVTWDMSADEPYLHTTAFALHIELAQGSGIYMVINLTNPDGSIPEKYSVTYTQEPPNLNNDACRTRELWLHFIPPNSSAVTGVNVDYGYYMGIFEVTQKQYQLVMGNNPSYYKNGDGFPVDQVTYNNIRGSSEGSHYPNDNRVDADSFMGRIRAKTGLNADLPTQMQWEYACRAGTTTNETNAVGKTQNEVAWYWDNREGASSQHKVGLKAPNAWGCYDMLGNMIEFCRDWYNNSNSGRALRGGRWGGSASESTVLYGYSWSPSSTNTYHGFRLAVLPADK